MAGSTERVGRRAVAIQADRADPKAVMRSFEEAVAALGGLDILSPQRGGWPSWTRALAAIDAVVRLNQWESA